MTVTTPDWLTRRGGEVRPRTAPDSWTVNLNGEPLYLLQLVPVVGKFGCRVTLTNNGRRLDRGQSFATPDDALHGGLDDLRQSLGW